MLTTLERRTMTTLAQALIRYLDHLADPVDAGDSIRHPHPDSKVALDQADRESGLRPNGSISYSAIDFDRMVGG